MHTNLPFVKFSNKYAPKKKKSWIPKVRLSSATMSYPSAEADLHNVTTSL